MDVQFHIVALMLCLLLPIGIITTQALNPLKDYDVEAHLQRLNKPAIKSIMLEDGDIIDCVDIYKQPGLDHPLLKDHTIKMSPSSWPKVENSVNVSRKQHMLQPAWQKSEGCPDGTIPIRRVQKSDLFRASSLEGFGRREVILPFNEYVESAGAMVEYTYYGIKARITVWNVPVVEDNEFSSASVEINDGAINKNFLQAGWIVNPKLYGDRKTRLYAYWTADAYHNTGCYNIICPGFIQIGRTYVLGSRIEPLSVIGGGQYSIQVNILKDKDNASWWLQIEGELVGYWPMEIFYNRSFKESGRVNWGGGVLNMMNEGQHTTTQMGSGQPATEGTNKAAAFLDPQVMDSNYNFAPPDYIEMVTFYNVSCYSVRIPNHTTIFFGGPGGHHCEGPNTP